MSRLITAVCLVSLGILVPAGTTEHQPAPLRSVLCDRLVGVGNIHARVVTTHCPLARLAATNATSADA